MSYTACQSNLPTLFAKVNRGGGFYRYVYYYIKKFNKTIENNSYK